MQAFDGDNKNMYVMTNIGLDKVALVEYDAVAKREMKELLSNKDYDLGGIQYNRKKTGILKVNGSGEKAEKHFFDKE